MNIKTGLSLLTMILVLGGCGFKSHSEVEALNEVQAVGSPFTQNLASEYRTFANVEQNSGFDYPDALHFARKGLAAAAGEVVLPEPISDWNTRPEHIEELAPARSGLVAALDRGGREQQPQLAAVAQARFDCWIEQQEENWNSPEALTCKKQFFDALNQLGGTPMAPPADDIMAPVTAGATPSTPMMAEDAKYIVFFDFDTAKVDQAGDSIIDSAVAELARQQGVSTVMVVGNTDTSGSDKYNQRLGMKRANAVRESLKARGVEANVIQVDSRGENTLMVPTPDGVREPANRRVEITFVK